jgi:parallel beta-helix repeat protein
VVLRGAGASTILNMPNDAFGILVTPSGANLVSNVIIENLNLTGAGVEKSWNTLIMISYAENITVQNCYFTGAGFHSIFAVETDYSLFTKNQISGSNMDAIALAQGSNHNVVSNNFVTNMSNMADMNGIDINGKAKASTFNTVINNTVLWAHVGICFDTASHNIAQGNTISHVVLGIDNTGTGGTTPTTDNWLIGNTISYSEGTGGYSAG